MRSILVSSLIGLLITSTMLAEENQSSNKEQSSFSQNALLATSGVIGGAAWYLWKNNPTIARLTTKEATNSSINLQYPLLDGAVIFIATGLVGMMAFFIKKDKGYQLYTTESQKNAKLKNQLTIDESHKAAELNIRFKHITDIMDLIKNADEFTWNMFYVNFNNICERLKIEMKGRSDFEKLIEKLNEHQDYLLPDLD